MTNQAELFHQVKTWLKTENLSFAADENDHDFYVRMNLENGLVQIRLVCEESPLMLQLVCILPTKVPKDKIPLVSLWLHNLNVRLRIGAFHLISDERVISFRLALPLHAKSDLHKQFGKAFNTVVGTVDDNLQPLALLCSTDEALAKVAKLMPAEDLLAASQPLQSNRLELN